VGYKFLTNLPDSVRNIVETNDHPPVAAVITGTPTLNEGSAASFDASGSTDPDAGDVLHYSWNFGDGTPAVTTTSATTTHVYADNGSYTTTVAVFDQAGASSRASVGVSVANVAPTAVFNAPATATEGSSFTLSLSNVVDPSATDVAAGLQISFNCGNGFAAATTATSVSCPDNTNTTLTVGATITDKDGGTNSYTGTVVVQQVLDGNINSCSGNCIIPAGSTFSTNLTINAGGIVLTQGTLNGNVTIGAGGKLDLAGGTASHNLELKSGGTLVSEGGTIGGNVQGGGSVSLDAGSNVVGNLQLVNATSISVAATVRGGLQITSPAGTGAICGAHIRGDLQLVGGGAQSAFTVGDGAGCGGNTVGGNVQITANRGTVSVMQNIITGNLQCEANAAVTSNGNTTINGKKQGQCTQ
jgi:hypothetical protein